MKSWALSSPVILLVICAMTGTSHAQITTATGEVLFNPGSVGAGSGGARGTLMDNGSIPNGTGWAVSGAGQSFGGFSQYQPFTISDPAWQITDVGVDGYTYWDPGDAGMFGAIYADNGGLPDLSSPLTGAVRYDLAPVDQAWTSNWRDRPLPVTLTTGTYWFGADAGDAGYSAALFDAVSGDRPIRAVTPMASGLTIMAAPWRYGSSERSFRSRARCRCSCSAGSRC